MSKKLPAIEPPIERADDLDVAAAEGEPFIRVFQSVVTPRHRIDAWLVTMDADARTFFDPAAPADMPPDDLPLTAQIARETLINVSLVRNALDAANADEATEAALRAVNAWWRLRTMAYEKQWHHGFKGLEDRRLGGTTTAIPAKELRQRIAKRFKALQALKTRNRAEIVELLRKEFGRSSERINAALRAEGLGKKFER